jgi:hypothetical protein
VKLRQLKRRHISRLRLRLEFRRIRASINADCDRLGLPRLDARPLDEVLPELLRSVDPEELAKGRAWVQEWAAEGYPGMEVVDITDWIAPGATTEQLNAVAACPGAEMPPCRGRITGYEITGTLATVSMDAPGGPVEGPSTLWDSCRDRGARGLGKRALDHHRERAYSQQAKPTDKLATPGFDDSQDEGSERKLAD